MRENINHRNYFLKKEEKIEEKPEVLEKEEEENPYTEGYLYNLKKKEQIKLLEEFGFSKKEIKKLKYEEDRVQSILKLINEVE